jgi:hypothetical protein
MSSSSDVLINDLELGNPAADLDRRPQHIFCAVAGFLAKDSDSQRFEAWIANSIQDILLSIREAAATIP